MIFRCLLFSKTWSKKKYIKNTQHCLNNFFLYLFSKKIYIFEDKEILNFSGVLLIFDDISKSYMIRCPDYSGHLWIKGNVFYFIFLIIYYKYSKVRSFMMKHSSLFYRINLVPISLLTSNRILYIQPGKLIT